MTVLNMIKRNLFSAAVVLAYAALFAVSPETGVRAVRGSGYYIREMLLIMPVIFVLTALLDLWVPKEKITQYLGRGAGVKGVFLSFVVGSVSAGPVYAAFPMCVMLRKKGASIRNVVIILSAWAVIKIPMLINEAKFLGPRFMAVRWVLTIISIVLFSWIADRLVSERDLPAAPAPQTGLSINRAACMGCALCVQSDPELFEMKGKKAQVRPHGTPDPQWIENAVRACPVKAIVYIGSAAEDSARQSG